MAARTENQSAAAPVSAHAIGPAPATMNGLSAALIVASLFDDKFGNVWISSLDHIPVQWCSQRAAVATLCLLCVSVCVLEVNRQLAFALTQLEELKSM